MKRRGWIAVALVVMGFAGWAYASRVGVSGDTLARVERGELRVTVEITGELEASQSDLIGPPQIDGIWEYKISFLAPEGSEVTAGTPVLGFDTTELNALLEQRQSEAEAAAQEIEKLRPELEKAARTDALRLAEARARVRQKTLEVDVPGELIAARELATARLDLELAEREIAYLERKIELDRQRGQARLGSLIGTRDRATMRVEEIGRDIGRMTIPAPRAGTVVYVDDGRGDKKAVGDAVWQAEKVVEIPDLDALEAKGTAAEVDLGRLAQGQAVTLELDAHPGVEYRGRIRDIHGSVTRRSRTDPTKEVRLGIDLDETDPGRMRPGMRFRGRIEIERLEDILLAPIEAIRSSADGPVVIRGTAFGREALRPELGRVGEGRVEVLSGLSAGDRLLIAEEDAP